MTIERGSIVRHRPEFLRSVQWHTDVPLNGIITDDSPKLGERFVRVWWCDRQRTDLVARSVIELHQSADDGISHSMRQALLAESDDLADDLQKLVE